MENEFKENYEVIDYDQWPRKGTFEYFKHFEKPPYITISIDFDITNFKKVIKEKGWSFTYAFDYLAAKALQEIPDFRVRVLRSGELRSYEILVSTIQVLDPKDKQVKNIILPIEGTIEEFVQKAHKQQTEIFENESSLNIYRKANMIQFSSLPWIPYTATSQDFPVSINGTPFIIFGKYSESNGKILLPVTIMADHRFIDGYHVGLWYEKLQKSLIDLK